MVLRELVAECLEGWLETLRHVGPKAEGLNAGVSVAGRAGQRIRVAEPHVDLRTSRPPLALERLSVIRDAEGRITRIRYVLPRPAEIGRAHV